MNENSLVRVKAEDGKPTHNLMNTAVIEQGKLYTPAACGNGRMMLIPHSVSLQIELCQCVMIVAKPCAILCCEHARRMAPWAGYVREG
eukprot:4085251-Amphidinium_carterae.1